MANGRLTKPSEAVTLWLRTSSRVRQSGLPLLDDTLTRELRRIHLPVIRRAIPTGGPGLGLGVIGNRWGFRVGSRDRDTRVHRIRSHYGVDQIYPAGWMFCPFVLRAG